MTYFSYPVLYSLNVFNFSTFVPQFQITLMLPFAPNMQQEPTGWSWLKAQPSLPGAHRTKLFTSLTCHGLTGKQTRLWELSGDCRGLDRDPCPEQLSAGNYRVCNAFSALVNSIVPLDHLLTHRRKTLFGLKSLGTKISLTVNTKNITCG